MPKVICTLPNAAHEINGVKFTPADGGVLSEELTPEQAEQFLSIPGYAEHEVDHDEVARVKAAAAAAAQSEAAEAAEAAKRAKAAATQKPATAAKTTKSVKAATPPAAPTVEPVEPPADAADAPAPDKDADESVF